ncbi:MAG: ubiquitin-like small modifier protein 1 [Nitrososphaerota archaeon]|nr:MoaD family protein [Candidatus Calditenuaceae archaeon]MDW8072664.1 ubiquitin-like small modifier protein 1 [Nitrososphaerota archaeon]
MCASITVKTRYYAYLHEITGVREEEIALDEGSTVAELVELLVQKYGPRLRAYILSEGLKLRPNVAVAVNGVKVSEEPLKKVLRDGDTVVILPPVSGGAIA